MLKINRIAYLGLVVWLFVCCRQENNTEKEIEKIPISFQLDRFDKDFAHAKPQDLSDLKAQYPRLFPEKYRDSMWIKKMQDSLQKDINREVLKKFSDFGTEKKQLHRFFQHVKYYFPDFKTPRVITITSEVDYKHKVVLSDSLLIISLDTYLGKDHRYYRGIQRYFAKNFEPSQILPDVAQQYARKYVEKPRKRSLLAYMVYYGKLQYFKAHMLPDLPQAQILGYTDEEWNWVKSNERQIWGYFMENNFLYGTDPDLRRRFLDNGPFTKFGLKLDSESPAQSGQYIGWQIVQAYIDKHTDKPLQKVLKMDNETLFKESNYKPKQD